MEEQLARQAERAEATGHLTALNLLAKLEQRYRADHGDYTEDLTILIGGYESDPRNQVYRLWPFVQEGSLRVERTVKGMTLWVQAVSGEWVSRELIP